MNTFSLGQYIIPGLFLFILIALIPIYFFVDLKNINLLFKILIILFLIASVILFIITIFSSYTRKNKNKVLCKKSPDSILSNTKDKLEKLKNSVVELKKSGNYAMFVDEIESSACEVLKSSKEVTASANEIASYFSNCGEKEIDSEFIEKASIIFNAIDKSNSLVSGIKSSYDIICRIKNGDGSFDWYKNARQNNTIRTQCDEAKNKVQESLQQSLRLLPSIIECTKRIIGHIESIIKNMK